MTAPKTAAAMLCGAYFLSGLSALVLESVLFQLAGFVVGNSPVSVAVVLSSFMGGLAIGYALAGRLGPRVHNALIGFAVCEGLVGLTGFLLVLVLPTLPSVFAPLFAHFGFDPVALAVPRFVIAFLLMLVPSTAMGMTLPLVVASVRKYDQGFGTALGRMYAWNTIGAVCGALIADAYLVKHVGIVGASAVAAGANILAAVIGYGLSRSLPTAEAQADQPPAPAISDVQGKVQTRILISAFLAGFLLLALEVVWFRFFLLFKSAYADHLARILAVVLTGIAVGGALGARLLRQESRARAGLAQNGLIALIAVLGTYAALRWGVHTRQISIAELNGQILMMLPVSIVSGFLFTQMAVALAALGLDDFRATSRVAIANAVGSALGSVVAGFWLIQLLGIEGSLFWLGCGYALIAVLHLSRTGFESLTAWGRRRLILVGAVALTVVATFPRGFTPGLLKHGYGEFRAMVMMDGFRVFYLHEGRNETIQYYVRNLFDRPHQFVMMTNNHPMSAYNDRTLRYMKMYSYLPASLHGDLSSALLISFGVGNTARSLTHVTTLDHVSVVDISNEIIEASRILPHHQKHHPLDDPRVDTVIDDGRFFLLTTEKRFDLITAEPPPPRFAGVSSLYSQEFFELAYERLNPGGYVTYWLPIYQLHPDEAKAIVGGFCHAFNNCTMWTGAGLEWMLVGARPPLRKPTAAEFASIWEQPAIRADLARFGIPTPSYHAAQYIAGSETLQAWVGDTPPLTDQFPQRLRSEESAVPSAVAAKAYGEGYTGMMTRDSFADDFLQDPFIRDVWPEEFLADVTQMAEWRLQHNLASPPGAIYERAHFGLTHPLQSYPVWMPGATVLGIEAVDRARKQAPEQLSLGQLNNGELLLVAANHVFHRELTAAAGKLRQYQIRRFNAEQEVDLEIIFLRVLLNHHGGDIPAAYRDMARAIGNFTHSDEELTTIDEFWGWLRIQFPQTPPLAEVLRQHGVAEDRVSFFLGVPQTDADP